MDQAIADIRLSGTTVYYLGEEADGRDLDEVYQRGQVGSHRATVGYGYSCTDRGETRCGSHVYITTEPMERRDVRASGCERIPPVLGVPAARRTPDPALMLFTAGSIIVIVDVGYDPISNRSSPSPPG